MGPKRPLRASGKWLFNQITHFDWSAVVMDPNALSNTKLHIPMEGEAFSQANGRTGFHRDASLSRMVQFGTYR
jgi:hypothetical protein